MLAAKAYKVHIYPSQEQKRIIDNTFDGMRFVYNKLLEYKRNSFNDTLGNQILPISVNELVEEWEWLKTIPRHILFQAQQEINTKFNRFIKNITKYPMPHYHSKHVNIPVSYEDYTFKFILFRDDINGNPEVNLPRIGYVPIYKSPFKKIQDFVNSRKLTLNDDFKLHHIKFTKSATGDYFATIIFVYENGVNEYDAVRLSWKSPIKNNINVVSINDLQTKSHKIFCIDSDGNQIPIWNRIHKYHVQLQHILNCMKRKREYTNRVRKLQRRINVLTERLERVKRSYIHQISNEYASKYETCFLMNETHLSKRHTMFYSIHIDFRKYLSIKIRQRGFTIYQFSIANKDNILQSLMDMGLQQIHLERNILSK